VLCVVSVSLSTALCNFTESNSPVNHNSNDAPRGIDTKSLLERLNTFIKEHAPDISLSILNRTCQMIDSCNGEILYEFPTDRIEYVQQVVLSFLLCQEGEITQHSIREWAIEITTSTLENYT
jgi:hypothetical protein